MRSVWRPLAYPGGGIYSNQDHLRSARVSGNAVVGPMGDYDIGAHIAYDVGDLVDEQLVRNGNIVVVTQKPHVSYPYIPCCVYKLSFPVLDVCIPVGHLAALRKLIYGHQVGPHPVVCRQ